MIERRSKMTTQYIPPEWAFEFHGHECPFMPIGYRMGKLALEYLGVEKEPDHGFFVFPELGEGHPQTCMMDGMQVATGATYGKVMIAKTFYGKLAATFYHPQEGRGALLAPARVHRRHGQVRVLRLSQEGHRAFPDPAGSASGGHPVGLRPAGRSNLQGGSETRFHLHARSKARSTRPNAACAASTSSTATCA